MISETVLSSGRTTFSELPPRLFIIILVVFIPPGLCASRTAKMGTFAGRVAQPLGKIAFAIFVKIE